MICLIWTHGKEKLVLLINNYHSDIKFTHDFDKENISFLRLKGCLSLFTVGPMVLFSKGETILFSCKCNGKGRAVYEY